MTPPRILARFATINIRHVLKILSKMSSINKNHIYFGGSYLFEKIPVYRLIDLQRVFSHAINGKMYFVFSKILAFHFKMSKDPVKSRVFLYTLNIKIYEKLPVLFFCSGSVELQDQFMMNFVFL